MINPPSNINELRATWRLVNNLQVAQKPLVVNKTATTTDFYVYDVIGYEEDQALNFMKEVHQTKGPINLYINSPGGFVWDAISMYEALLNSSSKVNVEITGIAASAASFLAMAGDSVKITEPGRMMVHDAQGIGIGSPSDLRIYADLLDSVSDDIAGISSEAIGSKLVDGLTGESNKGPDNRTRLIQARNNVLVKGK